MSDRRRLRREDPVRTHPIRNWASLFQRPGVWPDPPTAGPASNPYPGTSTPTGSPPGATGHTAGPHPTADETSARSPDDPIAYGVDLGYRVVDEHIRQGQRVAAQLRSGRYGFAEAGGDIQELATRTVRYATDLAAMWIELLGTMAGRTGIGSSGLGAGGFGAGGFGAGGFGTTPAPPMHAPASGVERMDQANAASDVAAAATSVDLSIDIDVPARVSVHLAPHARSTALITHGLRSIDAGAPAITDVALQPGHDDQALTVRIRIPPGQAPGLYTGVIVDAESGRPHGTLAVHLDAPSPGARHIDTPEPSP